MVQETEILSHQRRLVYATQSMATDDLFMKGHRVSSGHKQAWCWLVRQAGPSLTHVVLRLEYFCACADRSSGIHLYTINSMRPSDAYVRR